VLSNDGTAGFGRRGYKEMAVKATIGFAGRGGRKSHVLILVYLFAMSRQDRLPNNKQRPRTELDTSACQSLDVSLKSLRKCSRLVQQTTITLDNDLHVLERIYYKCKNTQRPTLAWKKVVELRRVANRMREASLERTVDNLRRSFFNSVIFQEGQRFAHDILNRMPDSKSWRAAPRYPRAVGLPSRQ
jgi:hypothetical protein